MWSKTSVWNDYCVLFCRKLNGIFLNILQDWRSYRFLTNWFSIRWQKCWSVLYCNSQHNQFIHKIFDSTCTSCRQNWNKPKEMLEKKRCLFAWKFAHIEQTDVCFPNTGFGVSSWKKSRACLPFMSVMEMFWSHNHEQNYLQQHQACNSEWCIESNIYPVFFTANFNKKDSLSIATFFLFCEIFVIQYQIGFLTMFFSLICILMLSKSNWNGWMLTAIAETYRFPSWNLKVTTIKSSAVVGFGF